MRPRRREISPRYVALDELLDVPAVRILRALMRFDWVSAEDLNIALDVTYDKLVANNYATQLGRLSRERLVDRRTIPLWKSCPSPYEYGINDAGRHYLATLLARSSPERELGELDDIEAAGGEPQWKRVLRRRMATANRARPRDRARRAARRAA